MSYLHLTKRGGFCLQSQRPLPKSVRSIELTSLEGIEIAVRQHVLERISPEIGIFLSAQVASQRQAEADKSKAVSVNSASRKGKLRNSK
jgi:hypothetical protein